MKDVPITRERLKPRQLAEMVGRPDAVVLELGANRGSETAMFLRIFPHGRVYSFEPDPRAIGYWKGHNFPPRAVLTEAAVGNQDGTVRFHQSGGREDKHPQGWDQSGSIKAPKTHLQHWPTVTFEREIEVPIVKLDTWLEGRGIDRIDFLWADVQGAEGDVVAGGRRALAMTRYFYTEYTDKEWYEGQLTLAAIAALLPDFDLVARYPMDALFRNRTLA